MATIEKDYEICYAHRLIAHEGKCNRLHGHNARIKISISGPIKKDNTKSDNGMVMDFGALDDGIGKWINNTLDHRTILEVGDPLINALITSGEDPSLVVIDMPPTAELLAAYIHSETVNLYSQFLYSIESTGEPGQVEVTFWETPKACAIVTDSSNFFNVPVNIVSDSAYVSTE